MKEIKFRAWDKHNKKWITQPVGFTMSVVDGKFHVFGFDDAFADMYQIRVELQQYTGIKDKNGVEIYEGDILRSDGGHWNDCHSAGVPYDSTEPDPRCAKHRISIYPVEWSDATDDIEGGMVGFYIGYLPDEPVEVIGNIHENPELLK